MKSLLKKIFYFLKNLLWPQSNIAGLEINDIALHIAQLNNGALKRAAIILEPGIIENGIVKDGNLLIQGLKRLHNQFSGANEKVPVVFSIPSVNVYVQMFNVPFIAGRNFDEAVKLNLETISPIDVSKSYYDAEQINKQEKGGKIEALGAFASSEVVDEYVEILDESGFIPVAAEFPALAIARSIKELGAGIDFEKPQVVLNVASDGINFMIVRYGNLYFDYFVSWRLIQEDGRTIREISFIDFKQTIIRELQKVFTFYRSHWEGSLDQLILITQALNSEIIGIIKEISPIEVIELKLSQFGDLPTSWFAVLGSAFRGKIPRSKDDLISLMAVGTEKRYMHSEILFFAKLWRNVIVSTLAFLVLLFIFADSFLARTSSNLEKQLQDFSKIPEAGEVAKLQEQARVFNQLADKSLVAKEKSRLWSPFFIKINSLFKNNIAPVKISVDVPQSAVLMNGSAKSEAGAIDFKNALIENGFQNVNLPLSSMETDLNGGVSFTISFKLPLNWQR